MIISIENDIISVNESSQFSQANYSLEEFRIISNTSVESTEKKTYSQANNRNEFIFTSSIYAENLAQIQILNAFEIQSSYMSAKFNTFDFTNNFLFSQFVWANSRASRVRMKNLIDVFAFESSKTERNKRDKNVQNLRRIVNQRKISISNESTQNENSTLKQYDDATAELLTMIRITQEHVKIELSIDRFLINYQFEFSEFKKKYFNVEQWFNVFSNSFTFVKLLRIFIIERLIFFDSNANFIVQLKLSNERSVFTFEFYEQIIFYRFKSSETTRKSNSVVIDIYENKKFQFRSKKTLIDAFDFHFAKRYWNVRISVTIVDSMNKKYHELSKYIVANLCVIFAANQNIVEIFTKININIFAFFSMKFHREIRHRSTNYSDFFLKLIEVQNMSFELSSIKFDHDCRVWTKSKKELINEEKLWWKIAVTSVVVEQTLEENKTFELNEICKWQFENIVEIFIVRQMHYLARDIVTRIDSVDYHNSNSNERCCKIDKCNDHQLIST